ncbi:MAG: hypothetical protein C4292_06680, partial [Nitrososphaera sp.]
LFSFFYNEVAECKCGPCIIKKNIIGNIIGKNIEKNTYDLLLLSDSEIEVAECKCGPCVKEDIKIKKNIKEYTYDCVFKTRLSDYKVIRKGTLNELVYLDLDAEHEYIEKYLKNLQEQSQFANLEWQPCHYFDQLWKGVNASHTVYNYSYFLSSIFYTDNILWRELLVMDEAHQIESEMGDFHSFTINKSELKFLPEVQMPDRNVDDIDTWIDFCSDLQDKLLKFIEQANNAISKKQSQSQSQNKIAELQKSEKPMSLDMMTDAKNQSQSQSEKDKKIAELYTERNLMKADKMKEKLQRTLDDIRSNKENWIVSNIQKDIQTQQLIRVILTPLETSDYFGKILNKGAIAFFMSATILSKDYLCKVVGLDPEEVKFIRVGDSDFPIKNRPIYLKNTAWLNAKTMAKNMPRIVAEIDKIMTTHRNDKGIIHTTSYAQLRQIRDGISRENASRLIETGATLDREEVLEKHRTSKQPTVLISPSMYQGVDLKDDLSRFQIIVKVPYPDLTDKRVFKMKERDPKWYKWHTVLRLVQSYGRSIRSADDHAETYILDSSITYLLKSARDMIPKWFMEAVVK